MIVSLKLTAEQDKRKSVKSLLKVREEIKNISALHKRRLNTDTILGIFIRKTLAVVIIFVQPMMHCRVANSGSQSSGLTMKRERENQHQYK